MGSGRPGDDYALTRAIACRVPALEDGHAAAPAHGPVAVGADERGGALDPGDRDVVVGERRDAPEDARDLIEVRDDEQSRRQAKRRHWLPEAVAVEHLAGQDHRARRAA